MAATLPLPRRELWSCSKRGMFASHAVIAQVLTALHAAAPGSHQVFQQPLLWVCSGALGSSLAWPM